MCGVPGEHRVALGPIKNPSDADAPLPSEAPKHQRGRAPPKRSAEAPRRTRVCTEFAPHQRQPAPPAAASELGICAWTRLPASQHRNSTAASKSQQRPEPSTAAKQGTIAPTQPASKATPAPHQAPQPTQTKFKGCQQHPQQRRSKGGRFEGWEKLQIGMGHPPTSRATQRRREDGEGLLMPSS